MNENEKETAAEDDSDSPANAFDLAIEKERSETERMIKITEEHCYVDRTRAESIMFVANGFAIAAVVIVAILQVRSCNVAQQHEEQVTARMIETTKQIRAKGEAERWKAFSVCLDKTSYEDSVVDCRRAVQELDRDKEE